MNHKPVSKELAKLYEKQGYLEEALACYLSLYEQTKDKDFVKAIESLKNKITPSDKESGLLVEKPLDETDKNNLSSKTITLFEQWLDMLVLKKKIQNYKKIQTSYE